MKYLGINRTKEMKDWYNENFKILLKESKEDINKWKYIHSRVGTLNININKMSILPK